MTTAYTTHTQAPGRVTDHPSHSLAIPLGLSITLSIIHFGADTYAPLAARMTTWAIGCLALFAISRYLNRGLFQRLPFPEFALAQGYLVWGMPTITDSLRRGVPVSRSAVTDATLASVLFLTFALIACPAGQWAGKRVRPTLARAIPRKLPTLSPWLLGAWLLACLLMNTGARRLLPVAVRYPFSIIAGMYGILVYVSDRSFSTYARKPGRLLILVAAAFAAAGMLSGMLISVILPLAAASVLFFMRTKRVPWRWLLAGIALFAILNPAKQIFREEQGWHQYDKTRGAEGFAQLASGPLEGIEHWAQAISDTWTGEVDTSRNTEASVDRFNDLSSVARTIDYAGRRVPFNHGEQWKLMPYSFLPRVLYPEKPDFTVEFNDRFNLAFGIRTERAMRNSTYLFPVIADGYWNFGWLGVLLVGTIIGFYWGFVANLWDSDHWGLRWLALGLFASYNLMNHLYGQIGGLPQTVAGVVIGAWTLVLLARISSPSRSQSALD